MQVLMPIASHSKFFPKEEYFFPKPLIEIAGRPMIDRVVGAVKSRLPGAQFTFVAAREDVREFSIDKSLTILGGRRTRVIEKNAETRGGLCSCLLAIDAIDHEAPMVIANSDQIIDAPLEQYIDQFMEQGVAAGVLTFRSVHPRWAYVVSDSKGLVSQTFEKKVMSNKAIAGFYFFRRAGDFFDAAKAAMLNDDQTNGEFFISAAINQVILKDKDVGHIPLAVNRYYSLYSPEEIKEFGDTEYARRIRGKTTDPRQVNVVIPAAGEGSRFAKAGWSKPKPFIDVNGSMMLNHVIDNVVPSGARPTLLLRSEHMESCAAEVEELRARGANIRKVDALTEGTACTVLLARDTFDARRPMMVANSDQWVDFDVSDFVEDCLNRDLDGSILVFRDPTRDPKWSFARVNDHGLVMEVAEKKPISDLATVGIYLFRNGSEFVSAAVDMIARNERVNGEFYTCPVYNYMIRNGLRIGVYEVAQEAMKGLGTPDDLTGYLCDIGAPMSSSAPPDTPANTSAKVLTSTPVA